MINPETGVEQLDLLEDERQFDTIEVEEKVTILKPGGRAAVVVPDNCLFAAQAGDVFEILTEDCELHTVLRLPNGTFSPHSPGTKTNVIFFTKGYPTDNIWIYDARTNVPALPRKTVPSRQSTSKNS
jgi:type I restriction enzyme M protein